MSAFLDLYTALDVIGNGSFGIIRKVQRKSDGLIFARKELNFERMSERDRKQIVAEVNILKDLHHDHIVRYHDRYVDRDNGILYILMEYCGGGDLSTVIKQSLKHNRTIPEDTIWSYFLQLLLALQYCHHPNAQGGSGSGVGAGEDGKERRPQILHRDLKPDNVFLDENNAVKLGDFGLSKALAQASFANTYVGTPYYMSPELMQEKAYDTKSDIWSLGCLIYELCALKPPFHEAKTHTELSAFIQTGRIPPLPRCYSQALTGVVKAMLNLNPAMRPSAAQLLQHERLELVFKVSETEKMLATVKAHKATLQAKEREVAAREATHEARLHEFHTVLAAKDAQIATLSSSQEQAILAAVAVREGELRLLVMAREQEVAAAMLKREDEIMSAIRAREQELGEAWRKREEEVRGEVDERVKWVLERESCLLQRETDIKGEEERLAVLRREAEEKLEALERGEKGRKEKTPLEEVKNLLARMTDASPPRVSHPTRLHNMPLQPIPFPNNQATPLPRVHRALLNTEENTPLMTPASAMKGVVFTLTGESLATPSPTELSTLFVNSPRVGLNFGRIFDSRPSGFAGETSEEETTPPPSPSKRVSRGSTSPSKTKSRSPEKAQKQRSGSGGSSSSSGSGSTVTTRVPTPPVVSATRIRRPSIRTASRPGMTKTNSMPVSTIPSTSDSALFTSSTTAATTTTTTTTATNGSASHRRSVVPVQNPQPLRHPHLPPRSTARAITMPLPVATFDDNDDEDMPSPFLKRTAPPVLTSSKAASAIRKRPSNGNMLRAVAAANSAAGKSASAVKASGGGVSPVIPARAGRT